MPPRSLPAVRALRSPSIRFPRVHQRTLMQAGAPKINPVKSILIANRGEIALRVSRTAHQHGVRATTIYTEPDALAEHAHVTPFSANIGLSSAYLDIEKILQVAKTCGCDSVHPGYGFLSENAEFAKRCAEEGLVFIGPPSTAIESMGNKSEAKNIMESAGVPCIPGYHGPNQSPDHLLAEAEKVGFPVLIKAVKGGGGKGMRIARTPRDFPEMLESAKSEARSSFGDDVVLVERYITTPRHIEVQVFADKYGNCVALGERDCSVQRRHQKIIEESPAPSLAPKVRQYMWAKARDAALAVGYEGAGTVEFIFDNESGDFFFMEMNTRLQVEHPVTEMVTRTDLVHWQLLVASGHPLPLTQEQIESQIEGHSFEARIYAENPDMNFMPDSGKLVHLRTPVTSADVRIDAGFREGDEISSHYDPMIAKLIVRGSDRETALAKLRAALEKYEVVGPSTNIEFLKRLAVHPSFVSGDVETGFIEKHHDDLFSMVATPDEVYAQAALSLVARKAQTTSLDNVYSILGGGVGFTGGVQRRQITLQDAHGEVTPVVIDVEQRGEELYEVTVDSRVLGIVKIKPLDEHPILVGYYQHARIESTVIRTDENISVFQHGKLHQLKIPHPPWLDKVLNVKDATNSVVSPMPCKVLRVLVAGGDSVAKDQPLVVVESMKMEMVIRSPHDGVISRVVHEQGDVVKAGVSLVLFEEAQEE